MTFSKPEPLGGEFVPKIKALGFPYTDSLILTFAAGSALHGASLGASTDLDVYGIFIEPPEKVLGLDRFEHFNKMTWEGGVELPKAGDLDVKIDSLRKWAGTASRGNATAAMYLFCDSTAVMNRYWKQVQENRHLFLSKGLQNGFLGFADAQLKRMVGERGMGQHGQRDELIKLYGYDTKNAMHVFRLMFECKEVLQTGVLTYPRPEKDFLISIRKGVYSLDKAIAEATAMFAEVKALIPSSPLPEAPNRAGINQLLTRLYLEYWEDHGWL